MGSILECVQQTAEGGRPNSLMWTDRHSRIWLAESIANFSGDLSAMTAPSFILSPTSLTEYPVSTIVAGWERPPASLCGRRAHLSTASRISAS
jgi:hypothetical protein